MAAGRRRRWAGRIARWTGTALCGLILLVYMPSGWYVVEGDIVVTGEWFRASLKEGAVVASWWWGYTSEVSGSPVASYGAGSNAAGPAWHLWPSWGSQRHLWTMGPTKGSSWVVAPLWLILTSVALPTAWLWRRELRRRHNPNLCSCGYDLTGLPSGAACPECGKVHAVRAGMAE
jgi:hypothetical protein